MRFDLPMLDELSVGAGAGSGAPLQLAIADIDEDPAQPRREFDAEALRELAATIAERGVRQPVSVRPHPQAAGRWVLNFGARRLRASRLAGKTDIPAFVDPTADSYDQVIENEQREALRPIDLALFVQREIGAGRAQAEIARRLGKSGAYITYVCALIDPPDWLMSLYREGRCRGVKELYDLRRLHETDADAVTAWLQDRAFVARGDVEKLRASLETSSAKTDSRPRLPSADAGSVPIANVSSRRSEREAATSGIGSDKRASAVVGLDLAADLDGNAVRVLLEPVPRLSGQVYVEAIGTGQRCEIAIALLQALRLVPRCL